MFFFSKFYQTFLWSGPISFLVIYMLFCLVLVWSDGMLTSLLSFVWVFWDSQKNLWVFLSVPQLVVNCAKILDEWGRNILCDCTLRSLLVYCTFELIWLSFFEIFTSNLLVRQNYYCCSSFSLSKVLLERFSANSVKKS